ncbi:MAG: glycosyltransferase family 4 protein [Actinomycetota bacterium]
MARALLVSSSFLPGRGGIESYLGALCTDLAPSLAVLAAGERDGEPLPVDLGYPTYAYPGRLLWPGRKALGAVVTAAGAEETSKIVFGTPWPLVLLGPRLARRGLRYAVIVHGAEMLVPSVVPGIGGALARALAGAELLLPVSEYTATSLRSFLGKRGLPEPPVDLLRARVDLERFRPDLDTAPIRDRLGLEAGERIILCFGRLVPRKGVDRLISALPEIRKRIPDAVVVVAGTGPELRTLESLAEDVGGRVVFTHRVAEDDAPALYAAGDVFALPVSDRWFGLEIEGLGVVLLEAAAAGTPSVTGRSGGTPEAVIDEVTGFVIDGRDRAALVDRICTLLEQPELARSMASAGRRHVAEHFSAKAIPEAFLSWLEP